MADRSDGDGAGGTSVTGLASEAISGVRESGLVRSIQSMTTTRLVLAITAVAVLVRLVGLGARPMHFDEGRVGYFVLQYADSGSFTYRHGIHGPFIQHVDRWLFTLVGASDFTARLPVALAGGLVPAVALLFRKHLKRAELVALALFLTFNSVLVYYSRFMRSDMLLAAFVFAAFGCLVRLYDTRNVRYLYAIAVLVAFGFASKENAFVYVLTWIGATALLADQALFRPRERSSGLAVLTARYADARGNGRRILTFCGHVLAALLVVLLVLVFMYADRGAGLAGIERPPVPPAEGAVGFWEALANPVGFPGYAYETLSGALDEALRWSGRAAGGDESLFATYLENLGVDLEVLGSNAIVLMLFAGIGFLWERYARARSRNLVLFAGYCGFVSLLGYPLADDIGGAHWLHVHILLPLSIPAAVAATRFYEWFRTARVERDTVASALAAVVLVLAGVQVAVVTANDAYVDTTSRENNLVQYAQPEGDFRAVVDGINRVSVADREGTDVVVYTDADFGGDRRLVSPPQDGNHTFILRPACVKSAWYNAISMHWTLARAGADVSCATDPGRLKGLVEERTPPIIVTRTTDDSVPHGWLDRQYSARVFDHYQYGHQFTVYLHDDWVPEVEGWTSAGSDPPSDYSVPGIDS